MFGFFRTKRIEQYLEHIMSVGEELLEKVDALGAVVQAVKDETSVVLAELVALRNASQGLTAEQVVELTAKVSNILTVAEGTKAAEDAVITPPPVDSPV